MTAEQGLRGAIINQSQGFSYEELAFHLMDSRTYRNYCRIGFAHKAFKTSVLCKSIKATSPQIWGSINRLLVAYGVDKAIERGREVRIDCPVTCSNIREPTDATLLWDSVRVFTRLLEKAKEELEINIHFTNHYKRAKNKDDCHPQCQDPKEPIETV